MSRGGLPLWSFFTLATLPASLFVWVTGGYGMCGESDDRPHDALGDSLCNVLAKPIVPWVLLALIPTALAGIGTGLAIRRQALGVAWLIFGGAYLVALAIAFAFTATF